MPPLWDDDIRKSLINELGEACLIDTEDAELVIDYLRDQGYLQDGCAHYPETVGRVL